MAPVNFFTLIVLFSGLCQGNDKLHEFVVQKIDNEFGNWLVSRNEDTFTIPNFEFSSSSEFYSLQFSASNMILHDFASSVKIHYFGQNIFRQHLFVELEFSKGIGLTLNGTYNIGGTLFDFVPVAGFHSFSVKGEPVGSLPVQICDISTLGYLLTDDGYIDSSQVAAWHGDFYRIPEPDYNINAGGFEGWLLGEVIRGKLKEHVEEWSLCWFLKDKVVAFLKEVFDGTSVRDILAFDKDVLTNP